MGHILETLWYYLGYHLALRVKITFHPTLLSMWIKVMPLISSSTAAMGINETILVSLVIQIYIFVLATRCNFGA